MPIRLAADRPNDPPLPPSRPFDAGTLLAGRQVLIVEDDPASAKLLAIVLEGESCATRVATSAEAALTTLTESVPDLIVLDLILPLMSGLLFAQHVRATPATTHVPIIAVSAFNGSEAERVARAAGCNAYVRKPIDALSFPELVRVHLGVSNEE